MRNQLLVSAAVLGFGVMAGTGEAQTSSPSSFAPTQGQVATVPSSRPVAVVIDNNNAQAQAKPGAFAVPTPGTIVIHINGRVHTGFKGIWSSADQRLFTAPVGSPGASPVTVTVPAAGGTVTLPATTSTAAILGNNGAGVAKLAPDALYSYARLYFGADAMATNGLRYGAGIELREDFTGQLSSNTSSNASGYSSSSTIFVRRAFTYIAGDQWGIVRAGAADGLVSIFDNGVTTFQYLPTNNLQNGDDYASLTPGNTSVPFFFLSGAGNEYANTKLVYLSPQFAGVDIGIQYAPSLANGYGLSTGYPLNGSLTGTGTGTGISCATASSGCPTLSSGPGIQDGARILNQTAVGARYEGVFGDVGMLAYAVYEFSGHADYTGVTTASVLGNTAVPGSLFNGKYEGLNFGNGGIALTYAGFTIGGNIIGGRLNGQLGLVPQHGVSEIAYMFGAKYANGPFTIGVAAESGTYQGAVNLAGLSQRRGQAIDVGASYNVAPGFLVYAEYQYDALYQGGFNFITSSVGSAANNSARSQGIMIGNVVNF